MNPPDLASIASAAAGGGRGGAGGGGGPAAPAAARGAAAGTGAGRGAAAPPAAAGGAPQGGGRGAGAPGAAALQPSEKLGDGVWRTTGQYNSLVIDFKDHIMILEAGGSLDSATAVIAEARRLVPNKPIRYVMNTHPHADHTAGLPAIVAEGAAIITHRNNQEFFERAFSTPRTLLTDSLAKNPKKVNVEGVGDRRVFSDGNRVVEFYHVWPVPHSNGLLVAYLPKEKILFQGDFSLPAAGQPANDHVKALVPILEKLKLDFDRYINVHNSAAPQTKADLWKAVGK
jgi:glyoxylase-like metal-dependent hydrolase (beta-lactamase superfamily II)